MCLFISISIHIQNVKKHLYCHHFTQIYMNLFTGLGPLTVVFCQILMVHEVTPLNTATDRLFDCMGLCSSYVAPDVALFRPDRNGWKRRTPRFKVFGWGVADKFQVLHSSRQLLLWAWQNRISLECCTRFIKTCPFIVVCVTYQQWMSQDQTGPLDWTGWGWARSGQRFFHSTGPAWSLESERSTASRLPHPLPWWRLLSGSKHPAGKEQRENTPSCRTKINNNTISSRQ